MRLRRLLLLCVLLTAACGQAGPLYLPDGGRDAPAAVQRAQPSPTPAPAGDDASSGQTEGETNVDNAQ